MPAPGTGTIDCQVLAGRLQHTASSAYPLKIISPQAARTTFADGSQTALHPAVSYVLSYGGGLVHGDRIHVRAAVHAQCALLLLTQGSTKVFRKGARTASSNGTGDQTVQTMELSVHQDALLCLLPDPVTCFAGSRYHQRQAVDVHPGGSLLLLDWMTSGRMSRGERWQLDKYLSVNLVTATAPTRRLAIRDALLLEDPGLRTRLHAIDAFALLFVLGPHLTAVAQRFRQDHREHRIRPFRATPKHASVEWSVSEVSEHGICGVA
ncbi:hypothetical protein IWW55_007057, partial [Coemansia sp. RSA 2706]